MNIIQKPAAAGNYQVGRNLPISRITFHYIYGDAQAAINRFQTPGVEVSSTYVIGSDGQVYQMVKESDTPYSDGDFTSNSKTISIEHAGGNGVPYTDAMYESSIQLVRDLIARYGMSDFKRHRDIIATACPGDLDVERIISGAQGADMSDLVDENISKVLQHGLLGRNGLSGRSYALNGSTGLPWIGAELTAQFIMDLYNSPEAKNWRDSQEWACIPNINDRLNTIPGLQQQIVDLKNQLANQPVGTGGYTEADRAVNQETNNIVKQIWQKLTSVFK
jgi:hypothetical protein